MVNLANQRFVTSAEVTPAGNVSVIEARKFNQPLAGNEYFYRPVNLNTRVDESDQVDTLNVFNGNSPANDVGVLTSGHLTGLGMGGDAVIAGRTLPGGIVYRELEVLNIALGTGNDDFTVLSTHAGATNISAGAGNDIITVRSINGHTSIDAGAGADQVRVSSDAAKSLVDPIAGLLTVDGGNDTDSDTLAVDDRAETTDSVGLLTGSTLTGLDMPTVGETQSIFVQAAGGVYRLRANGMVISLDYSAAAAQVQAALAAAYGFADIRVDESRTQSDVTYTVTFFGDHAGIDFDEIAWAETLASTGLVPNPDASALVRVTTVRDGATVNTGINNLQTVTINPNVSPNGG